MNLQCGYLLFKRTLAKKMEPSPLPSLGLCEIVRFSVIKTSSSFPLYFFAFSFHDLLDRSLQNNVCNRNLSPLVRFHKYSIFETKKYIIIWSCERNCCYSPPSFVRKGQEIIQSQDQNKLFNIRYWNTEKWSKTSISKSEGVPESPGCG